jgi:hypothetical protein
VPDFGGVMGSTLKRGFRTMSETPFPVLVERLRAGNTGAAADFLKLYEPEIKRIIHVRLFRDTRLRHLVDTVDICQSVWIGFFKALAELDLEDEKKVLHLLGVIQRGGCRHK